MIHHLVNLIFFFFNDPPTTEIYPLPLHAPLPISARLSPACVMPKTSRASDTAPRTAAAATITGLIRIVRPVGLPCRPLKFLFDDDAQSSAPTKIGRAHV